MLNLECERECVCVFFLCMFCQSVNDLVNENGCVVDDEITNINNNNNTNACNTNQTNTNKLLLPQQHTTPTTQHTTGWRVDEEVALVCVCVCCRGGEKKGK
jgi:hypothetical protein